MQSRQGWIDDDDWASWQKYYTTITTSKSLRASQLSLQLSLRSEAAVVGGCEATLVFPKLEDAFPARFSFGQATSAWHQLC